MGGKRRGCWRKGGGEEGGLRTCQRVKSAQAVGLTES